MSLSDNNRKYILMEFLRGVHHLTDKEYQKRVWIRGEGPECDDLSETACYFFDEVDLILKQYKAFKVTENQYQILKKFRDEFEVFMDSDQNAWDSAFIDSPEWAKIIEGAKEIIKSFNYQLQPWMPPS